MRSLMVLAVTAAGVVLLTLILTKVDVAGSVAPSIAKTTQPAPEVSPEETPLARPTATTAEHPPATSPIDEAAPSVSHGIPTPPHVESPPKIRRRFPSVQEVRAGMARADLKRLYGEPAVTTAQTTGGRFVERYIYVNEDHSATFAAVLENGRVVRTETKPY